MPRVPPASSFLFAALFLAPASCGEKPSDPETSPSPTPLSYSAVAAGDYHSCALTEAGNVQCWGAGGEDDMSDIGFGQSQPLAGAFRAVSAGGYHSCAVREDNTVVC
jgi:alpha-tubulin suppressor-like RCC1 family protein